MMYLFCLHCSEDIQPGHKFATKVGKGLAVGDVPKPPEAPPAPSCPSALETRQLVQYPLISEGKALLSKINCSLCV